MAGQFTSLGDIKQAAFYRGDLEGFTDRHPLINVNQEVNASWRDMRLRLANNDVFDVLATTAILTLPTAEFLAGGGWAEVPWPVDAVSIHGVDVKVGGTWCSVPQGTLAQRRMGPFNNVRGDYQFADDGQAMWIAKSLPTTNSVVGSIMLFPVPSGGQYLLWYLQSWADITTDTTDFPMLEGWANWVAWDLAVKLLIRDIGAQNEAQLEHCKTERDTVWKSLRTNVQRIASDGPIEVQSRYGSRRGGYRMIP